MYRAAARESGRIAARTLAKRRWIAPLLAVAAIAAALAFRSFGRARVSLHLDAYEMPVEHPGSSATLGPDDFGPSPYGAMPPLRLAQPTWIAVGYYVLRRGTGPFEEKNSGELRAWYSDVSVSGERVELAKPEPRSNVGSAAFVLASAHGATWFDAPSHVELGYETGDPRRDVAESISRWMSGPKTAPLELAWSRAPPDGFAWLAVTGIAGLACALLWRARTVIAIDGPTLSIASRVVGTRTERIPRGEIRTVVVDARTFGPLVYARPAIVTNDDRKIFVGARVHSDVEAGELARRIRELLG